MSIYSQVPTQATPDSALEENWWNTEVHQKLVEIDNAVGTLQGIIVMWSGSIISIPSGWRLCDGGGGTPDLRNRFIVGAGSSYSVGATGGTDAVTLSTAQIPAHTHGSAGGHSHNYQATAATGSVGQYSGDYGRHIASLPTYSTSSGGAHTHSSVGSGESHENRPPFYSLAFIQKL